MLKTKIRLNLGTRETLLLTSKMIQKLKNKDYGQKENDEECRENNGSDEDGLPIHTFQVARNNRIWYHRTMYGYTGIDSG